MRRLSSALGLALAVVLMVTGCAGSRPRQALNNIDNLARLNGNAFVHTVRWHGETLSAIAKWYTGKAQNWKRLANTDAKFNPVQLKKGYKILIPRSLLITTAAMPEEFVHPRAQTTRASGTISLFGPKD